MLRNSKSGPQSATNKHGKRCKSRGAARASDYTTVFTPNGNAQKKDPLNKQALQKYKVEHWAKFSSPQYDCVLTLENYHLVKDRNSSAFYIQDNKVKGQLDTDMKNIRNFKKQNNRKQIDTFV